MKHTKFCICCKQVVDISLFHKNLKTKDGLERRCKPCRKKDAAKRYKENWFSYVCKLKKAYCKKNNIDFDLTAEYLKEIWTNSCPVLKVKFIMFDKSNDCSPALDRINPKKGYIKNNVCFISARANRIKYDASIQELEQVINYIKQKGK
jgi:hypothetical protein